MRLLALALAFLASCNSAPWVATDKEVERSIQTVLHEAETFSLEGDARIVAAARGEGVPLSAYVPPEAIPLPPPMPPGTDWGEIIVLALTALGGSAGAIGYRAFDHKRKKSRSA